MNVVKKILLVHPDQRIRRRCVMLLAACGFDVRALAAAADACQAVQAEWFDLAVVDHDLPDAPDFSLAERLRRLQPTLSVMLLVEQLEFPLVVEGIRQGVSDVIPPGEDLAPIVARVCAHFEVVPTLDADLASSELKAAEAILDTLGGVGTPAPVSTQNPGDQLHASLVEAAREKSLLEAQLERVAHERNALEVQLKTLLTQAGDTLRLRADAAEIKSQREIVAAAQAAIDEKARLLAEKRAEISRERSQLEQERRRVESHNGDHQHRDSASLAAERARLAEWRRQLGDQSEQLRAEAARVQQDRAQLAAERQSWHKDLDTLRDQEENLRRYETRLRELQAHLETERVGLIGSRAQQPAHPPEEIDGDSLKESWSKFRRATELFEAEKSHLKEDRLALRDWEKALQQREQALLSRDAAPRDQVRPAPLAPSHPQPNREIPPAPNSGLRSLTKAPFEAALSVLRGRK